MYVIILKKRWSVAMEKVITICSNFNLDDTQVQKVNDMLNAGWTVKFVKMASNKHFLTTVFVLEKK